MKNRFLKKAVSLFIALITVASVLAFPCFASDSQPSMSNVQAVCVVNVKHKKIVLHKDEHKIVYPASTVKLMTAMIAHEAYLGRLTEKVTVTKEMLKATVGRHLGLSEGEKISVEDLLYALLVGGYNDAANILAFSVSGSIEAFCELMNSKAAELGALNTHYTNPTGLHSAEMVTTAYDTALISLEFMNNSELFPISKAIKHTVTTADKSDDFTIYNRNYLITTSMTEDYYYAYAQGMNAGSTDEGGDCVVTAGCDGRNDEEKKEYTYVCVVMGGDVSDPDINHAYKVAKNALKYALVNFSVIKLKSQKSIIATLPVEFSATDFEVNVKMTKDLSSLIYSGIDVDKDVEFVTELNSEKLDAPVKEGQVVGHITAKYKGNVLDECELVASKSIDAHGFLVFMYKMKKLTQNPFFIIPLLLAIGAFVFYKIKTSNGKKKNRRRRRRYY